MEGRDSGAIPGRADMRPWDKPLSKILLHDLQELHDLVEGSPLVVRMRESEPSRSDYISYLVNVYSDISVVEQHLRRHGDDPRLCCLDLEPLYRAEALEHDIVALAAPRAEPLPCIQYHRAYFDVIASHAPYLLVAHAAVRYLGLLFGGQQRRERLYGHWGDAGTYRLYEFSRAPKELIPALMRELDRFYENLDELERARFYNELITAWEFAGDLLENNIRCMSIKYRPSLSMAGAAHA
jgi:heme oxygenase